MKMMILGLCILLAGCAATPTPYQKCKESLLGATGGYEDVKIQDSVYAISFTGNAYMTQGMVNNLALLRGADITLDNGYEYFVLLEEEDITREISGEDASGDVVRFRKMYNQEKYAYNIPERYIIIKCYEEEPFDIPTTVYKAEEVRSNLREAFAIK